MMTNVNTDCQMATKMEQTLPQENKFQVIELPYSAWALEPIISRETVELHHDKHLKAYVDNLNALVPGSQYERMSLEEIAAAAEDGPVLNNAGQVLNHNLYFQQFGSSMNNNAPNGALAAAIDRDFGSFEAFKEEFVSRGVSLFGSGWVWLSSDQSGHLSITQEPNGHNPVMRNLMPLLGFDVWEHAYYVDYQNKRADHLKALWQIVDWDVVAERYAKAVHF